MQEQQDKYYLTTREAEVLQHIIRQYIRTANPIGSRTVSKQLELQLSAATIRNVMSDLEEKGFLDHPHTSAGRIPTDQGYRYFVDTLVRVQELQSEDKRVIARQIDQYGTMEQIIREASKILSRISHQLAIVSAPSTGDGRLQRIDLVELSSTRLMVILHVTSGAVRTIMFEIDAELTADLLFQISAILNERLAGLTLREIKDSFTQRVQNLPEDHKPILELFIQASDRMFSESADESRIYIDGIRSIMEQPEFVDPEQLRNIIEVVENHNLVIHILDKLDSTQSVIVRIGQEFEEERLKDCSLVLAPYRIGSAAGTVGIIGPRRMDYTRMVSIVDYIAKLISQ